MRPLHPEGKPLQLDTEHSGCLEDGDLLACADVLPAASTLPTVVLVEHLGGLKHLERGREAADLSRDLQGEIQEGVVGVRAESTVAALQLGAQVATEDAVDRARLLAAPAVRGLQTFAHETSAMKPIQKMSEEFVSILLSPLPKAFGDPPQVTDHLFRGKSASRRHTTKTLEEAIHNRQKVIAPGRQVV
eukprot:scaffold2044_cov247-Pinguiococcus_pyrenoidosus.AAC.15